ncbi:hypothetical protein Vretimale_8890 [Volvox reticuliferus]|uniref:Uncharacterized protein n=1 Tax=Volvox reticuliferus TaxID=1737510 RepID=A0A8J4CM19_9CHLO|nr:hypothetical protein Vretifemale_14367 [Volvox reticuliferus]GIM04312.1 hypothetical protein Vretimale_8890 [Volvox reticuliferus]
MAAVGSGHQPAGGKSRCRMRLMVARQVVLGMKSSRHVATDRLISPMERMAQSCSLALLFRCIMAWMPRPPSKKSRLAQSSGVLPSVIGFTCLAAGQFYTNSTYDIHCAIQSFQHMMTSAWDAPSRPSDLLLLPKACSAEAKQPEEYSMHAMAPLSVPESAAGSQRRCEGMA